MAQSPNQRNPEHDSRKGKRLPRRHTAEESQQWVAARNEEIRQYLRDRHDRLEIVKTTRTASGQQLDWIPIESQPGVTKVATPPDEDRSEETIGGDRKVDAVRFELQTARTLGPSGTVPIVRKPIDQINPGVALNDWLAKGVHARRLRPPDDPAGDTAPDGVEHKYGYTSQRVPCFGTEGSINVWDPYVEWSNEFSLGQLWLTAGEGGEKQTIEIGHQEYRDKYGDWVPHLFVFFTTNNYTDPGNNKGGYNQEVDGWVQYSNQIYPEATYNTLSHEDSAQYELQLKVQLWEGNWWIRVNGIWMGYYPGSLFDANGLQSAASKVAWGGEVIDAEHSGTTRTDMGNGHFPEAGWRKCAFMRNLKYQASRTGAMNRYEPVTWESHPLAYGVEGHFDNTDSWGSYFWWGGSGKNAAFN
ncbi:neprosin family prolyl endopeptidase [Antrihabitans sp. YC2-6]|uniref:neprosin family prolyl endopeptidase n=1 Tax=Antrihabitans sp. YC2-6 TaxID=2799498 RepID=UPI0018F6FB27|nr:neprosin family prolyl endopeptidase [Antrihabitans sp. YC2-6]MBJ8346865.1 neprosin family prolyl endopeptidase [Antrihabitans sp. YC2-6]